MAKEFAVIYPTGQTNLKGEIWNQLGQAWNTSGTPAFQAYSAAQIANYAAATGTEAGASGIYTFDVPAGINSAYQLTLVPFAQAGAGHVESDPKFDPVTIDWSGTAIIVLGSARAEPGQGAPPSSTDPLKKLDYLYKAWRNKKTQTATTRSLYADDGVTVDQKATDSDDGTTFTKGELGTGP